MKNLVLIVTILILLGSGTANNRQDVLNAQWYHLESETSDSIRMEILQKIDTLTLDITHRDSVIQLWDELSYKCGDIKFEEGRFFCLYQKAKELRNEGQFFESLLLLEEVLAYYEAKHETSSIADVHNSLGILYKSIDNIEESRRYYELSINGYKQLGDSVKIGWIYLNLGSMASQEGNYAQALQYHRLSESILKKLDRRNLVNTYINFGETYEQLNKTDSAMHFYKLACSTADQFGTIEEKFQSNFYFGKFLFDRSMLKEAEPYIELAKKMNENNFIENFSVADRATFYDLLSRYYASKDDFRSAYLYLIDSREFDNQNKAAESINNLNRLDFDRRVLEERRKRKNQNVVIIIILAGLALTLLFLIAVYRSYKHKQKANRLLTEMDQFKTRLFSDISHELRTPLTLILAPLEQMLSREAEKKPKRSQIKLMQKNAKAILNLVNQMLDLSKIDAKSMKLELSEVDITSFIRAHFAAFASLAESKNIGFNCYTPADKKIRIFDQAKLEKIINNLVSNAIKYTPDGGQVFCFANFPTDDLLELVIQDTGKGIPKDELPHLFDRFHQVRGSNKGQNIGTGIGLSLTKELVELMHGKIMVESILGEGSRFKISLPLGTAHLEPDEYEMTTDGFTDPQDNYPYEEEPEPAGSCNELETGENGERDEVLIVEDHPEISEFIRDNLRKCYTVSTAENGKIGLEMATEQIPDLIISDVMMPEMDGFELSKKLKTDERTSHIPIILLTAKSSQKDKMEGLETGVDAFLSKPFSMKELELRVKKLIEQRRKLRERFTRNLKLEPKDIAVSSADEKFLDRVMDVVEKNLGNTEFEVGKLQEELLLSRTQLFRKIKALTNQTPGEFIRTIRLKRAARLIEQKFGNIAQITYEVGFNNPSYFAKCFKELYGVLPSEYPQKAD